MPAYASDPIITPKREINAVSRHITERRCRQALIGPLKGNTPYNVEEGFPL